MRDGRNRWKSGVNDRARLGRYGEEDHELSQHRCRHRFRSRRRRRDRNLAAARKPAGFLPSLAARDPAVAWRLFRDLRPVPDRLHRAGADPQRAADRHHGRVLRLLRHRRVRRCDLRRIVRRNVLPGLPRRPLRPPRDLHLGAAWLHRGIGDHGVPEFLRRRAAVALPRRHRHRRRDHHHRCLHHRARAELDAGPRVRGQPGRDVHCRADRGVPRLVAGAAVAGGPRRLALGGPDRRGGEHGDLDRAAVPPGEPALAGAPWPRRRGNGRRARARGCDRRERET